MLARLKFLSSEILLGTMIAVLSALAAFSSYQGSMADGDQAQYTVEGQQMLTDANAEYLSANQMIVYDYSLFDGYYTAETDEKTEYYRSSFSEELQTSMDANEEDPFSDAYYEAMYAEPNQMFEDADAKFSKAQEFNERGDALQMVMLISALALAFAAWASLLNSESPVRLVFAILAIVMTFYSFILYFNVPTVIA